MDELSITLLSNACRDDFPENSVSNFANKVPKYNLFGAQQNPGNLQIALTECYVPKKFKNVTSTNCWLDATFEDGLPEALRKFAYPHDAKFNVPAGHYNQPKDLIKALNMAISDKFGAKTRPIVFSIAPGQGNKTKIDFKYPSYNVYLSHDISRVLGFEPTLPIRHPEKPGIISSPYSATTHGGQTQLYAYCSVVETSVLADQMVNLLAVLPWLPDNSGIEASQHIVIQNLNWINIVRWDFDSIGIAVKDGSGQEVSFYGSNTIFVCRIRRKPRALNAPSQDASAASLRELLHKPTHCN